MLKRMPWIIKTHLGKFRRRQREEDGKLWGESKIQEIWLISGIKFCHACFRTGVKDIT